MYWEGHKIIEMDNKGEEHLDEYMFMVQMILIDGTSMQQFIDILMNVELDENFNDRWQCKIYHFKSQNLNMYNDTSRGVKGSGAELA